MHALGDLFHKLFDYIGMLWPITIICPWETGVRVRLGDRMLQLDPGWHFVIPFVDVVYTVETNTEVFNTGKQTLDGVTVETVGAFRLVDPTRYFVELNDDPVVAVGYAVAAEVAAVLSLQSPTPEAARAVLLRARRRCKKWGIRLDWIEFRSAVECQSLRLLTDMGAPTITQGGV
jgi:hypothetical protein